jgi:hypothetical protein
LPDVGCSAGHIESLDARAVQAEIDRIRHLRDAAATGSTATRRTFALDLQIFARRRDAHPVKSRFHGDAHLIRIDLRIVLADRRAGDANLEDIFAIHGKVMLY